MFNRCQSELLQAIENLRKSDRTACVDTAVNFPKDFQSFLVVGLVEGLVSLARNPQGFGGVAVTGTETTHGFVCTFCFQFQFSLPAFPEQPSVLWKTHRILKKIFQHTNLTVG